MMFKCLIVFFKLFAILNALSFLDLRDWFAYKVNTMHSTQRWQKLLKQISHFCECKQKIRFGFSIDAAFQEILQFF